MFEFFIAKRYLKSKHKLNFITIISSLSTLGITIGVAALIIVLSVFNGFGSIVKSILINFDPHVRIAIVEEEGFNQLDSLDQTISQLDMVESYSPFVEGKVIMLNGQSYQILNIKGISENVDHESWGVSTKIVSGEFDITKDNSPDKIILGLPIALRLSARVGDTLNVTSAYNIEKMISSFAIPTTMRFVVSGLFESNNKDYDLSFTYTSLKSGQRLLGLRNKVNGYELRLNDIDDSEEVKQILESKFGNYFSVSTWYDLHQDLYNMMLIERWAAYIILCLIIAVATFNILGSLTMSVVEKKKDIGVLRSMGVSDKSILRIFMFEGILIGIIGTLAGVALGFLICYLQIEYNFYPLDSTKYIIDAMPMKVELSDIIAISIMSMLLSFLASLYPAKRAVKIPLLDAIKWE